MSHRFTKEVIDEYERIITSLSNFEAVLIELQEIIKKDSETKNYRKYTVKRSVALAQRLHTDITVYLLACELALGDGG